MKGLKALDIALDRKILAELAANAPRTFAHLAEKAKSALA